MRGQTRSASLVHVFVLLALAVAVVVPSRAQPVREPAPGVLLVADERMGDPRFTRTVVLLIKHDRTGSWGLIINKPTDVAPDEVLPTLKKSDRQKSVYYGGPVEVDRLVGLYQREGEGGAGDAAAGLPGVRWSDSPAMLTDQLKQAPERIRVFAGYAGWGPGQLELEIVRGGWRMIQGRKENVFSDDPGRLWERLDGALGGLAI